jgi:hypothetical protein
MKLAPVPYECALVIGLPANELVSEAQLLAEADPTLLSREEAVGSGFDHEAVDSLGRDLPPELRLALEEDELGVRQ